MPKPLKFLAFDTSTDRLSIAVTDGTRVWPRSGPGGAQASTTLIPAILALLSESGMTLGALDAIAFGRGPGSFTGLRTACAVAQGLAFGANHGAGIPVLPIDTLMAVAEEARFQRYGAMADSDAPLTITALLDARMDEMYVQSYEFRRGSCASLMGCELIRPENLVPGAAPQLLAGNVFAVYAGRLPAGLAALDCIEAFPTATALLRLAPALAAAGQCIDAAQALPLYVRDKVAQTTDERARAKAAALAASLIPAAPVMPLQS
ncbi:Inactive homolog of metal-dependent proteases, putative molecular chaperone [Polaromonas sp. CG9_12]|uniref:tRNA (adenosine(37)-N6)-threonylcarbamoyltransferase complex dimerization subunit type 1 TsaB n=1 Tax=Polaromonas sp. CG_9.11 TaxID=2787730 RepID=UPI0004DDDA1F|nr:tRNA (adenosine(37)-N6)-threonylcarbamoyltransferase complex dimerization subunit type 1 TsaB [Polaromonas sp. CG_9.11]MBG6076616.1 tRNA threonylcarbamoyladenosine biosynthesis protein TsaB [Polaromonas sp. CG_9.11]CDS53193.1 Inactive homolog of metal-dependent proteases, putative molecular chaperone [Polaromonas sp. CG9_12]